MLTVAPRLGDSPSAVGSSLHRPSTIQLG